jgi:hypothetical protein
MANHKLTREKAVELIEQQLIKINLTGKEIKFLGFKNDKFIDRNNTIIILKCIKHNVIFERLFRNFLGSLGIECPECRKQRYKSGITNKYGKTEKEILDKISKKLEELNQSGEFNLEFLGIKIKSTNSRKTKLY